MRPFAVEVDEECPKCLGRWWQKRYRPQDVEIDYDYLPQEALVVTCGNCGYAFEMATADAKVPA